MASTISTLFSSPRRLQWWQWGKLLGAILLLAAVFVAFRGGNHLFVGLALHVALDFTLQSDYVAAEKGNRGRALLIHAAIAGGIPSAVVALMAGSLVGVLVGVVVGISTHYAIDWTRKFGLPMSLGATLDQVLHVIVLIV